MIRAVGISALILAALAGRIDAASAQQRAGAPMSLGVPSGTAPSPAAPAANVNHGVPVPQPRPASAPRATDMPSMPQTAQPVPPPPAMPAAEAAAPAPRTPQPLTNPIQRDKPRGRGIDPNARELVASVNAYFNGLRYLTADFVQVGPDGRRTTGKLYLDKPGKVRFQYDAPATIELISDGQTVAVRDRKLATQDVYSVSQTPLRYLLADRVDLGRDANVVGITRDNEFLIVSLEERQTLGGTNKLMILFNASDMTLRQWTVTDAQGYDTSVAIHNIDPTRRPNASLFRIETQRIIQAPQQ